MPILDFSLPGLDKKILSGEKNSTTRLFKPFALQLLPHYKTLYLLWRGKTKERRVLGVAQLTNLFFLEIQYYSTRFYSLEAVAKSYNYSTVEQCFSVLTKDVGYRVWTAEITEEVLLNLDAHFARGGRGLEWQLMDHEWVADYVRKEGFDGWSETDFLFPFLLQQKEMTDDFFYVVEWDRLVSQPQQEVI